MCLEKEKVKMIWKSCVYVKTEWLWLIGNIVSSQILLEPWDVVKKWDVLLSTIRMTLTLFGLSHMNSPYLWLLSSHQIRQYPPLEMCQRGHQNPRIISIVDWVTWNQQKRILWRGRYLLKRWKKDLIKCIDPQCTQIKEYQHDSMAIMMGYWFTCKIRFMSDVMLNNPSFPFVPARPHTT